MKVIEESDGLLILEDRPVFFAVLMGGMIVFSVALLMIAWRKSNLMLGLAMAFTFGCGVAGFRLTNRSMWLTLDRRKGVATIRTRTRSGIVTETWPLGKVRASVQAHRSGQALTTRPVLLVDTTSPPRRHVLSQVFKSGDGAEQDARKINAFIAK